MKRIFPEFNARSIGCGAVLVGFILAAPVSGIQTGLSSGSTDPYFQKPSSAGTIGDDTRVAIRQSADDKQDWAPGSGSYTLAKQPTVIAKAAPKSIIRSTQDWNENQVVRNESFVPGDHVAATGSGSKPQDVDQPRTQTPNPTDRQAAPTPVLPPWRRASLTPDSKAKPQAPVPSPNSQNDLLSTTPPIADTKPPVPSTEPSTTGLDTTSIFPRQSPFQPPANGEQRASEPTRQSPTPTESQPLEIPNSFSVESPTLRHVTGADSKSTNPGSDVTTIDSSFSSSGTDSKDAVGNDSSPFEGDDFMPLGSTVERTPEESTPPPKSLSAKVADDAEATEPEVLEAKVEPGKASSFEPGRVLALVGGEPIFVADLLFDLNNFIKKSLRRSRVRH